MRLPWAIRGLTPVMLALAVGAGCASTALKQGEQADLLRDHDLAVASYARAVREDPNNREAQMGLDRAKLRASDAHFANGRRLYAMGRYEDALLELQLASELNPTNTPAADELRRVRTTVRTQLSRPEGGVTELESLLARTHDVAPAGYELPNVTLPTQIITGQQATSRTVFLTLAKLGNLSLTFDSQFREQPAPVTLMSGLTLKQALDTVARSTNTFYQVTGPGTIIVVPDTPPKRREYADEVSRQFVIRNADLKETMDALRVVADARYLAPISGTNTILVRDTAERVQTIGRLIAAFDKARPELVVDVEIMEVDRSRLREYGLQIASPGSTGLDGSVRVTTGEGISLESLRNLSQADVLFFNVPVLYYRLLKTDTRSRTLANPHLRMVDGVQATARFGQQVPVPTTVIAPIAQGGVSVQPQTSYALRDVGVNITIVPRTHPNDEVTLGLNIELTSLGPPGFDGLPTFGNRNVQTTIRLRDGETNVLGGLIREDERTERQTIPGLGDIPVLGNLFGRNRKEAQETDVVIMLTPHIVRILDLAEADLRPLRMPREGTGAAIIEPFIIPPPAAAPARGIPTPTPTPLPPSLPGQPPTTPTPLPPSVPGQPPTAPTP